MSSIISPSPVKKKRYVVTSADLVGSIPLQIDNFIMISGKVQSDGAYNGEVDIEIQKDDDTWTFVTPINGANLKKTILGDTINGATGILTTGNGSEKFPYHLRFNIAIQAGAGTVTIIIRYIQG